MSESIISGAYAGTKKVRRRKRRIRRFCENVNTAQDRKHFIRSFCRDEKQFSAENGSSGAFEEIKIQRMSESIISGAYAGTKNI